jgi:hypothetical protein
MIVSAGKHPRAHVGTFRPLMMRASRPSLALALGAVAVLAVLAMSGGLLAALPVLVLCAVLAFVGYAGEETIDRLRSSRQHETRMRAPGSLPCPRPVRVTVPRGSALLSWGRAVRPPPALAFVA